MESNLNVMVFKWWGVIWHWRWTTASCDAMGRLISNLSFGGCILEYLSIDTPLIVVGDTQAVYSEAVATSA